MIGFGVNFCRQVLIREFSFFKLIFLATRFHDLIIIGKAIDESIFGQSAYF
jgi:hypothetical protein